MRDGVVSRPDDTADVWLLVLGVICDERQTAKRQRLRTFYTSSATAGSLVRFVLSSSWLAKRTQATDEIGVNVTDPSNCAHKALQWWRTAGLRWRAKWYGKTDGAHALQTLDHTHPENGHECGRLPGAVC